MRQVLVLCQLLHARPWLLPLPGACEQQPGLHGALEAKGHLLRDPLGAGRHSLLYTRKHYPLAIFGAPSLRITAPRTPVAPSRVNG